MPIRYQEQLDLTFHALGDGTRRSILALLATRGECTASELGEPFDFAQPTVSQHLKVLERAGLLARDVDGRTHRFRVVVEPLNEVDDWITRHRKLWHGSLRRLEELINRAEPEGSPDV